MYLWSKFFAILLTVATICTCGGEMVEIEEVEEAGEGETADDPISKQENPITTQWAGEAIEKISNVGGGYQPYSIYRDSASLGWMCGKHWWEQADYVFEYRVPGAFANRARLKIRGLNSAGNCYVKNPTMARIYTDDTIRACVGCLSINLCSLYPKKYDTAVLIW